MAVQQVQPLHGNGFLEGTRIQANLSLAGEIDGVFHTGMGHAIGFIRLSIGEKVVVRLARKNVHPIRQGPHALEDGLCFMS